MTSLSELTALELAARIRSREISSAEATRYFLERIDRHNPALNAFVSIHHRRAMLAAGAFDRSRGRSEDLPPFAGVPSALKDLTPMFGSFTRLGSRAYRWFVSPINGPVVGRVKRGGFIILGKLATSEFGALPITEPDIHPPTKNPWDPSRTPGGSSGGSASAVAAGLLPIAQGSDGGGSIRIPSAFCHLFGFKPTLGLVGNMHGRVNILGMSVMGPVAQTVDDGAAMLDVLRDRPRSLQDPDSCFAATRSAPGRLKIGYTSQSPLGGAIAPELVRATEETAKLLESLGHHVEPITIEPAAIETFLPLWQLMLAAVPSPTDAVLQPVTKWLRVEGRKLTLDGVRPMQLELGKRIERWFGAHDVLLSPTVPQPAPPLGSLRGADPREMFYSVAELGAFTAIFNAADRPAASIPAGVSESGLPLAVQIGGRHGEDRKLLALAKQLEDARPWRSRHARARWS